MRIIGLDIHRVFAEAVTWEDGKLKRLGRVDMRRDHLGAFATRLSKEDVVIVEATSNAAAEGRRHRSTREAGRHCQGAAGADHRTCQDQARHRRRGVRAHVYASGYRAGGLDPR